MSRKLLCLLVLLACLTLAGCGEPESWGAFRALGDAWRFNHIPMGKERSEYADLPFVLTETTVLDEKRRLHHYRLEQDPLRIGPVHAASISYTFNHNDILKDIDVLFANRQEYEASRSALVAIFGEPQNTGGRDLEEWYYNSMMFSLGWRATHTPPGLLKITLLTPCKSY